MKKFKFRFEAVEKVRKSELDRQVRAMAEAQRKVAQIEGEIRDLQQSIRLEIDRARLQIQSSSELDSEVQTLSSDFRRAVRSQIDLKRKELVEALHQLERERRKLVEKSKNKKAMERLRENEKEKHYGELRKEEVRQLDEVGANLFVYHSND